MLLAPLWLREVHNKVKVEYFNFLAITVIETTSWLQMDVCDMQRTWTSCEKSCLL